MGEKDEMNVAIDEIWRHYNGKQKRRYESVPIGYVKESQQNQQYTGQNVSAAFSRLTNQNKNIIRFMI